MTALTLGVSRCGPPPMLRYKGPAGGQHLLIVGTTGAGKGSWINSAVAAAAVDPCTQIVMVDRKRAESRPWAARLVSRACTLEDIAKIGGRMKKLLDHRIEHADRMGWKHWQASPEQPVVLLVIDELPQAMKVGPFAEMLDEVLHMSRSLGITVIGGMQQANAKATDGTENRMLFTCIAQLFDREAAGYTFTFGKDTVTRHMHDVFGWLRYDRPGLAAWTDSTGAPWLTRAYYWSDADIERVVAATKHLAMPVDAVLPDWRWAA